MLPERGDHVVLLCDVSWLKVQMYFGGLCYSRSLSWNLNTKMQWLLFVFAYAFNRLSVSCNCAAPQQRLLTGSRNPLSLGPRHHATGGRESVCGHPGGGVEPGLAGLSSGRRRHARGLAAPRALAGSAPRRCMKPATLTDPVYPLSMHVVYYSYLLIVCTGWQY